MSWLETHIEEFVVPQMIEFEKTLGGLGKPGEFLRTPLGYFSTEEKSVIKNVWRSVKKSAGDKPILLAGRDVFIFEILARRENYPTTFIPECSRLSVRALKDKIPNVEDYFLFDTGFIGSIPRGLGIEDFSLLSFSRPLYGYGLMPNEDELRVQENKNLRSQIFPRMTRSRGLALKIEETPKYWETGRLVAKALDFDTSNGSCVIIDEITQPFSSRTEFENAARLTIEIYKDSSPKFVKKHRPIVIERR